MDNYLDSSSSLIQQFFSKEFYWWKDCDWRFDPLDRTLYIVCQIEGLRGQIMRDSGRLSRVNIGIDKFVISRPGYQDLIISCLSRYAFLAFLSRQA